MNIAQGSLDETEYYLILANDLKYSDTQSLQNELIEVAKILNTYVKRLEENK
jgi:four helix bundle protein